MRIETIGKTLLYVTAIAATGYGVILMFEEPEAPKAQDEAAVQLELDAVGQRLGGVGSGAVMGRDGYDQKKFSQIHIENPPQPVRKATTSGAMRAVETDAERQSRERMDALRPILENYDGVPVYIEGIHGPERKKD